MGRVSVTAALSALPGLAGGGGGGLPGSCRRTGRRLAGDAGQAV